MGLVIKLGCKWDTLPFTKESAFPAAMWSQKVDDRDKRAQQRAGV